MSKPQLTVSNDDAGRIVSAYLTEIGQLFDRPAYRLEVNFKNTEQAYDFVDNAVCLVPRGLRMPRGTEAYEAYLRTCPQVRIEGLTLGGGTGIVFSTEGFVRGTLYVLVAINGESSSPKVVSEYRSTGAGMMG